MPYPTVDLSLIHWLANVCILLGIKLLLLSCERKDWRQALLWRHNEHDVVSYHERYDCLLNRLFRRRSKKTSKLRVTGICAGNSPVTGEFPAQRASDAENISIWWRHHEKWPHHHAPKIHAQTRTCRNMPHSIWNKEFVHAVIVEPLIYDTP